MWWTVDMDQQEWLFSLRQSQFSLAGGSDKQASVWVYTKPTSVHTQKQ